MFDPPLSVGRPPTAPLLAAVVAAHRTAGHPGEMTLCAKCAGAFTAALAQGGAGSGRGDGRG